MATHTRLVFCRGRVCVHRRIQQQIFLGNSGVRNLGRIPVVLRHKRVVLSKSQAMTLEEPLRAGDSMLLLGASFDEHTNISPGDGANDLLRLDDGHTSRSKASGGKRTFL